MPRKIFDIYEYVHMYIVYVIYAYTNKCNEFKF